MSGACKGHGLWVAIRNFRQRNEYRTCLVCLGPIIKREK